jgi:PAS domain S-box-containing protein
VPGYDAAAAVGSDLGWLRGPELPVASLERAVREPVSEAGWRSRSDSRRFWCEATLFALRDDAGGVQGFAECFRDATEEHARNTALREAEARFGAALRSGSIVVFNQDRDLLYTWAPYVASELGISSPEQVLGRTDEELFPPEAASALTAAKRGVIVSGIGTRVDIAVETDTGTLSYDLTIEPLHDPGGAVVGITCASVNVTARARAQADLRRSNARLAEAERVARMGSWEWRIAENEVHWSDGLFEIYGIEQGDFPGRYEPSSERVHPNDRERIDAAVRRAVETGSSIDLDYRIVRADGRIRRLHGRAEVIADDQGRPVRLAGTVQDVTEVRAAEDALERTAAELTRRALELHRVTRHGTHAGQAIDELLSTRQLEILALVADGHSNAEIASRLFVTENTVKWHVRQILRRMGVSNRAQAVARYLASDRQADG